MIMSVFQMNDDALILLANRIVDNTLASDQVLALVSTFGYDEPGLQEGRA